MASRTAAPGEGSSGGASGELIIHRIPPIVDDDSRVLVLGTMPSPKSREVSFYYGNPQNRFWRVLAALWDEPVPGMGADGRLLDDVDAVNEARRELCHRRHVALWDVLASCRIAGASDASISKPVANDVAGLLDGSRIARVITTGSTATRLYRRLVEPVCGVGCTGLPSTSPANASWSLPRLVEAYAPLREAADS